MTTELPEVPRNFIEDQMRGLYGFTEEEKEWVRVMCRYAYNVGKMSGMSEMVKDSIQRAQVTN